jgi:hypothetical protein
MSQPDSRKDFDSLLAQAVHDTIKHCLGVANASTIVNYLLKRNLTLIGISKNPDLFSDELRNMVGSNRGQMDAASILEATILELLCKKLGTKFEATRPINFPQEIRKLKKKYGNEDE